MKTLTELPIPAFVGYGIGGAQCACIGYGGRAGLMIAPGCLKEEILRLDNKFRTFAGYPLRTEAFAQPWVTKRR